MFYGTYLSSIFTEQKIPPLPTSRKIILFHESRLGPWEVVEYTFFCLTYWSLRRAPNLSNSSIEIKVFWSRLFSTLEFNPLDNFIHSSSSNFLGFSNNKGSPSLRKTWWKKSAWKCSCKLLRNGLIFSSADDFLTKGKNWFLVAIPYMSCVMCARLRNKNATHRQSRVVTKTTMTYLVFWFIFGPIPRLSHCEAIKNLEWCLNFNIGSLDYRIHPTMTIFSRFP